MNTTKNTSKRAARRPLMLVAAVAGTVAMTLLPPALTASAAETNDPATRRTLSVQFAEAIWKRIDYDRPKGTAVRDRQRIERLPAHLRATIARRSLRGKGASLPDLALTVRTGAKANAACLSLISGTVFPGACGKSAPQPPTLDSAPMVLHETLVFFDRNRTVFKRTPRDLRLIRKVTRSELPRHITASYTDKNDDGLVDGGRVRLHDTQADRCLQVVLPVRDPAGGSYGTGWGSVSCP